MKYKLFLVIPTFVFLNIIIGNNVLYCKECSELINVTIVNGFKIDDLKTENTMTVNMKDGLHIFISNNNLLKRQVVETSEETKVDKDEKSKYYENEINKLKKRLELIESKLDGLPYEEKNILCKEKINQPLFMELSQINLKPDLEKGNSVVENEWKKVKELLNQQENITDQMEVKEVEEKENMEKGGEKAELLNAEEVEDEEQVEEEERSHYIFNDTIQTLKKVKTAISSNLTTKNAVSDDDLNQPNDELYLEEIENEDYNTQYIEEVIIDQEEYIKTLEQKYEELQKKYIMSEIERNKLNLENKDLNLTIEELKKIIIERNKTIEDLTRKNLQFTKSSERLQKFVQQRNLNRLECLSKAEKNMDTITHEALANYNHKNITINQQTVKVSLTRALTGK